jgi:tripartite-type tricarboxylate transporter receptor subunit TctC
MLAFGAVSIPLVANASDYPSKPIRLIVGFPPGGGTDMLARVVGQGLSDVLQVPVVIDNKAGASGIIGTDLGAKAPPDGYTLLLGTSGAILTGPSLHSKLPYDAGSDFSPIGTIGSFPNVLVVSSTSSLRSLADLVDLAKRQPGKLSYGSSGVGTTLHLSSALLQMQAGLDMVHVPYKDVNQASVDLSEGRIDFAFSSSAQVASHLASGRLRALATTGQARSPSYPDIPTVAELGFPDYNVVNWYSLLAPKGTPREFVDKLNQALNRVLRRSDIQARFAKDLDFTSRSSSPEELRAFIAAEQKRWATVIKSANIKLN